MLVVPPQVSSFTPCCSLGLQVVHPKRQKLAEAEATLSVVLGALRKKQGELQEVLNKLAALDADLNDKKQRKDKLEHDVGDVDISGDSLGFILPARMNVYGSID